MTIEEEIKELTTKARTALDSAFSVARADIQAGKVAKPETMHNIIDATNEAIENLATAIDALARRISDEVKAWSLPGDGSAPGPSS